jgi:endogenous inhibitor of DNA gyrase (YacG/DUF329 family)
MSATFDPETGTFSGVDTTTPRTYEAASRVTAPCPTCGAAIRNTPRNVASLESDSDPNQWVPGRAALSCRCFSPAVD